MFTRKTAHSRHTARGAEPEKRRRNDDYGGFTAAEVTFALHLYDAAGCSVNTAVFYLKQQLLAKHNEHLLPYNAAQLGRMIEDWFLSLDDAAVAALSVADCLSGKRRIARAVRFHNETKLRMWVAHQNVLKGLAPSTSSMALQWDSLEHEVPTDVELEPALRYDVMISRNRMWAKRFRCRWSMSYQKIPSRDNLSSADIHAKALSKKWCSLSSCFNIEATTNCLRDYPFVEKRFFSKCFAIFVRNVHCSN